MGHVSVDQGMIVGWDETEQTRRRKPTRQQETEEVKCPRCDSTNTKFCYYNNYNKSQPRHFCKSCKRHWTKGGTLRSVPFGGGRKNKRSRISNSTIESVHVKGPTKDSHIINQNSEFRIGNDKKDVTSITLLHESDQIMGSDHGANNETRDFQFSSLGHNFDVSSLIPSSCGYDQFGGKFDSMEESTVTSVNVPGTSSGLWPGTDNDNGYWDWNEIDVLTSADHLNIVWEDDAEIKP